MYVPSYSRTDDPALLREVIGAHPFATLVTVHDGMAQGTHLPFYLDGDAIVAHMAPSTGASDLDPM